MNESSLTQRIYDNLNWVWIVDPDAALSPLVRPEDVWSQIKQVWGAPDRAFVEGVYLALLSRPAEPLGLEQNCSALAAGLPRAALIRSLVQSEEAREMGLPLHWLPCLATLPQPRPRPLPLRLLRGVLRRAWRAAHGAWRLVRGPRGHEQDARKEVV